MSLFLLAVTLSYFLVGAGCVTLRQAGARSATVYLRILTIACSFPGRALTNTGVSAVIGGAALVELQALGPWGFLLCVYLVTPALREGSRPEAGP